MMPTPQLKSYTYGANSGEDSPTSKLAEMITPTFENNERSYAGCTAKRPIA